MSHTRVFEDAKRSEGKSTRKAGKESPQKVTRKLKASLEKTTLGDISDLAALKTEMEENQKKTAKEKKN